MLTPSLMSLGACNNDDVDDFPGDPYNRVYIQDKSPSYKIVQTPISTVSNLDFSIPLKCTQIAKGEIKATIEIDNSLIDEYNEMHGTSYEAMPTNAIVIENATMTIPAGAMVSIDTLKVKTSDDASVMSTLKSQDGYLVPLRIITTTGGSSQASSNNYSTFITVTITEDNVNHEGTEADITGVLVEDQSGWSATTNGTVSGWYEPLTTLFDNDASSYSYISINTDDLYLDIDMGKPYTFDAITLYYGYSWGSTSYNYTQLVTGMTIYTSNDGEKWLSSGEITDDSSIYCVFYAPITAQYIRMVT